MKTSLKILAILLFAQVSILNSMVTPFENSRQYFESGKFNEDAQKVIDVAWDKIKDLKINPNSTIVFDIDDTALTHCEFRLGYLERGEDSGPHFFDYVCRAEAPAVKPVLDFYKKVRDLGYKVALLTGRNIKYLEPTEKNLHQLGYTGYDKLILKTAEESEKYKTVVDYKSAKRAELVKEGYDIVASVGDQDADFEGPYTGINIKIPNPLFFNA